MDGMLSQDEINALLAGMGNTENSVDEATDEAVINNASDDDKELTVEQKDAVGEISNICMGTAATTLSTLLNQKVNITTPNVHVLDWQRIAQRHEKPCVMLQISYKEGISGNNVLILQERDVKIITDLMMGGTGNVSEEDEITELHLSAISEAMNQMMGSAATSLSSMFNRKIDISPPIANKVEAYSANVTELPEFLQGKFVSVAFRMQIGDLIDSEIMQLYPIEFAKDLFDLFNPQSENEAVKEENNQQSITNNNASQENVNSQGMSNAQMGNGMPMQGMQNMQMGYGMPMQGMPMQGMPMQGMQNMQMGYGMPMQGMSNMQMGYGANMMPAGQSDVNVAPASFQPFMGDIAGVGQKENINLIMDVPLEVTVELGRTTKSIKDILEFAPGTIVELNKIAGEAIDVLVNGKYVAKGEVVVIEESFGVRITEIIK